MDIHLINWEFYYMENTPVHEKRDEFGLTGIGSKWKHETMAYKDIHPKIITLSPIFTLVTLNIPGVT